MLKNKTIVLASASPRRREILGKLQEMFNCTVQVIPSTFQEDLDIKDPEAYVLATARAKGEQVYNQLMSKSAENAENSDKVDKTGLIVVSADTIVVHRGRILEKPADKPAAKQMLQSLSGDTHCVKTAVWIFSGTQNLSFVESTNVTFGRISDELLEAYIDSGEPFDKAGGYGYQGLAACFIEKVDGCYYNVIGFPLFRFLATAASLVAA